MAIGSSWASGSWGSATWATGSWADNGAPPSNVAPTASFSYSLSNLTASFTDGSSDSDGTIASRDWNWGDGTTHGTTQNPSHVYGAAGSYLVTLTVTDDDGATDDYQTWITVPPPAVPTSRPIRERGVLRRKIRFL